MVKMLSDRMEAMATWLDALGLAPGSVPVWADMTIQDGPNGRTLRCEVYDLTADGHKQVDERGKRVATTFVTVPLKVDPPSWWKPYVKPTRDDLLDVIDKLRKLGPDLEHEATAPGMHETAREANRDASRRIRALLPDLA